MNTRSNLLFCLLLLLVGQAADAQPFLRTYVPGSSGFDLVQTPDGGYILGGQLINDPVNFTTSAYISRLDADGALIWYDSLETPGATAVCLTTGNTLVWVSQTDSTGGPAFTRVMGMQPDGSVLWQTDLIHVGSDYDHYFSDVEPTADGGVVVFGSGKPIDDDSQFRLVKLNAAGVVEWDTYLGDPARNELSRELVVLPDGSLLLSGDNNDGINPLDYGDITLLKADPNGATLWQQWYDKPDKLVCVALAVGGTNQYGLLTTFFDNITQPGYQLLTVDTDGTETGFTELAPGLPDVDFYMVNSMCADTDGNYTLTGSAHYFVGGSATFVQQVNALGETQFFQSFQLYLPPRSIVSTSDGGFALTGWVYDEPLQVFRACLMKLDAQGNLYTNTISGTVFLDENNNCQSETGESPLSDFIVRAENSQGQPFYTTTAADGTWSLQVDTGTYTVTVYPRYGAADFWAACVVPPVTLDTIFQAFAMPPTGVRSLADCPFLDVDLGNSLFRPCQEVTFTLSYVNNGNQPAEQASLELTVDPLFSFVSAGLPATAVNDSTYQFELGDVAAGAYQAFTATFFLDCDAQIGQTLCAEAHIFPDTFCMPPNAQWDGSHLEITGNCTGNNIQFLVTNTGSTMAEAADFVIIEDQIIYMQGQIQLPAGEDSLFTINATNGAAYYMSVDQTPFHPGNSHPAAGVDACNGDPANPGLLLQLAQNEGDPFLATLCDLVRAAYDPNDKQGFPLGWQDANYIERGQELDYMIRFQNTGNDTAFLVIIRDTLDAATLDVTSLRPGASSHPYTWEVTGNGVLKFTFENILLPDSTTNLAGSQGYVQFRINQQPNLAAGTQILNRAGIYFDFNPPIITNTSLHTIADDLVTVSTFTSGNPDEKAALLVYPNPFTDRAQFELQDVPAETKPVLTVYNTAGQLVRRESYNQVSFTFYRAGLDAGLYLYRIDDQNGKMLAGGRMVVGGN